MTGHTCVAVLFYILPNKGVILRCSPAIITFCLEFAVFLFPSLFGLLDELGDCALSDPNCPLILGRDTELLRELTNNEASFISIPDLEYLSNAVY